MIRHSNASFICSLKWVNIILERYNLLLQSHNLTFTSFQREMSAWRVVINIFGIINSQFGWRIIQIYSSILCHLRKNDSFYIFHTLVLNKWMSIEFQFWFLIFRNIFHSCLKWNDLACEVKTFHFINRSCHLSFVWWSIVKHSTKIE